MEKQNSDKTPLTEKSSNGAKNLLKHDKKKDEPKMRDREGGGQRANYR
jgi:hypothetical protein